MRILFTVLFIGIASSVFCQDGITVSGVVKDQKTGETMPFVNVVVQSTHRGVSSNVDGYFTIFNVPTDTSTLLITRLGYSVTRYKLSPEKIKAGVVVEIAPSAVSMEAFTVEESKDNTIEIAEEVGKITLNPAQLENLPTLGEVDIFRSLQLLPGINGGNESGAGLYVRGGTPDQNLILLDGITVYHIDHFFGIFSAFNANAIKDVQVYKGGFESKFGGRVSSVVDITAKEGNSKKLALGGNLNMLSSNIVAEVPVIKNKASLLIAARRSYTDIIQSPTFNKIFGNIKDEREGQATNLGFGIAGFNKVDPVFHFYDINGKFTIHPTSKDIISLSFYNGKDNLDNSSSQKFNGNTELITNDVTQWGNTGIGARWARKWNDKYYSNLILSHSNYFSNYELGNTIILDTTEIKTGTTQDNNVKDITLRFDNEYKINRKNTLEFGLWIANNNITYKYTIDDTLQLQDRHDIGTRAAGYVQNTFQITDNFKVNLGVRGTYYDQTQKMYAEPRAAAYYNITKKFRLKGAWGMYNQFVNRVILENIFGGSRDFWLIADTAGNIPVVTSTHYIFGGAFETKDFLVDVEAWQKSTSGLLEYSLRFGTLEENAQNFDKQFYKGSGLARGIDFLIQKKFGKFTGWIAYTLSKVDYTFARFNNGNPFPALHDQRHSLKLVASLKVWRFNLASTFVYGTGRPYTAPIGLYSVTLLNGQTKEFIHVGAKNNQRLPDYNRLDFSINYEFKVKATSWKAGISFFNVYNRENIKYKRYQILKFDPKTLAPTTPKLSVTDVKLLGFVPNAFVKINF